jgi:hypothetical protein
MAVDSTTTRFICKICKTCKMIFEDQSILNQDTENYIIPKITNTINYMINSLFEGTIIFPKTKDEIVKNIDNKNNDEAEVISKIIDTIRYSLYRRYNDKADLAVGLEQQPQKGIVV